MTKLPFNISRPAIAGGIGALNDTSYYEKSLITNYQGKKYLYGELNALAPKVSFFETEANFIFIDVKQSADEIFLALMREGVIVRPLTSIGIPEAIRVTIGTREQNEKFIQALKGVI
jgi:histidinol-phosphate aminotransferase